MTSSSPSIPLFSPIDTFKSGMRNGPPWEGITDFVSHPSFCGMRLYPRQMTLLKLIYLETEQMTQYDFDVIEQWRGTFKDPSNPMGVQSDIWDRVKYLQNAGYSHFPHVQMVLGRRASKGILGGLLTTERLAYLYSLGSWQRHYTQVPGQIAEVLVSAPSLNLAVTRQFKDVRNTVLNCAYLREHVVGDKITEFFIRTPGDEQTIIENQLDGIQSDREIATIVCKASTAASTSGRGGTGIVNMYDEFAHMLSGTGSNKTGEEIYSAFQPSLDQFGKDALTYVASSPYNKIGKFYDLYQEGRVTMPEYDRREGRLETQTFTERAEVQDIDLDDPFSQKLAEPTYLIVQLPSWAQPLTTPVLTPDGFRPMGEIQAGDYVVSETGKPVMVTGVRRPDDTQVYRVTFNDGSSTRCSSGHLWATETRNERAGTQRKKNTVIATKDIRAALDGENGKYHRSGTFYIPMIEEPPILAIHDLPVPPYLVGFLLGDGCLRVGNSPRFAGPDQETVDVVMESVHTRWPEMRAVFHSGVDYGIVSGYETPDCCIECEHPPIARGYCESHYRKRKNRGEFEGKPKIWNNPLGAAIEEIGLKNVKGTDKFVPRPYLEGLPGDRLAILQGLMDSDGHYAPSKNAALFCNTSKHLVDAVVELAESLGGQARTYWREGRPQPAGHLSKPSWHVSIRLPVGLIPFRLPRKAGPYEAGIRTWRRQGQNRHIVSVTPDGHEPMQCISVDSEAGLYVTEHYLVTHNCLYEGWEQSRTIPMLPGKKRTFSRWNGPVQFRPDPDGSADEMVQYRRKIRNPDKFKVERCLDPATRVLCADFTWRAIDDLAVGDQLVGMDEEAPHDGMKQRRMRTSVVTGVMESFQKAYRLTFDDESSVICSGTHRWFSQSQGSIGFRWRSLFAQDDSAGPRKMIKVGDQIRYLVDPWEVDDSWEAGYLAGFFDGEGTFLTKNRGIAFGLSFSQLPGETLELTLQTLKNKGFDPIYRKSAREALAGTWCEKQHRTYSASQQWCVYGFDEAVRFIGSMGGVRMRRDAKDFWEGRGLPRPRNHGRIHKTITSIEELPEQRLIDIETSTRTFIAEGLISHNSAQFATVQNAYLDEAMVDRMFARPDWRDPLVNQDRGKLSISYRAHADPSRTNANFGFCIAHLEDAPPDEYGYVWPHVIIDRLHVWKPEDFPEHTIDYVQVGEELDDFLTKFPSIKKMSYDQYNSSGFIAHQKRKFPNIRILEQTFTAQVNQDRFERFKSALNLGWIHAPHDGFAEDGNSLLELELKFLQEKTRGSRIVVDKQDIGPVQTKDLCDAALVVCTDLLHDSLDKWWKSLNRTSVGSTNVAGLRSGNEQGRQATWEQSRTSDSMTYFTGDAERAERKTQRAERNKATLQNNKLERARRNSFGTRGPYTGGGRNRGGRD